MEDFQDWSQNLTLILGWLVVNEIVYVVVALQFRLLCVNTLGRYAECDLKPIWNNSNTIISSGPSSRIWGFVLCHSNLYEKKFRNNGKKYIYPPLSPSPRKVILDYFFFFFICRANATDNVRYNKISSGIRHRNTLDFQSSVEWYPVVYVRKTKKLAFFFSIYFTRTEKNIKTIFRHETYVNTRLAGLRLFVLYFRISNANRVFILFLPRRHLRWYIYIYTRRKWRFRLENKLLEYRHTGDKRHFKPYTLLYCVSVDNKLFQFCRRICGVRKDKIPSVTRTEAQKQKKIKIKIICTFKYIIDKKQNERYTTLCKSTEN